MSVLMPCCLKRAQTRPTELDLLESSGPASPMRCNVLDRLQKAENCRVALLTERRTHKPLSQLERTTYILNAELGSLGADVQSTIAAKTTAVVLNLISCAIV
jgi:hypothetical protein